MINEILLFGIAFLLGGNTTCQNAILKHMQEDGTNSLIINFTQMIRKFARMAYSCSKIKKNKKNSASQKFEVNLIDTYNYFNGVQMERVHQFEEEDAKSKAQYNLIMCRSFRFLQLLCENNNIEMKNFIRLQSDKEGTPKLNSINLLEFTTSQLRMFLKILNKSITELPNFMLEFVIEVI